MLPRALPLPLQSGSPDSDGRAVTRARSCQMAYPSPSSKSQATAILSVSTTSQPRLSEVTLSLAVLVSPHSSGVLHTTSNDVNVALENAALVYYCPLQYCYLFSSFHFRQLNDLTGPPSRLKAPSYAECSVISLVFGGRSLGHSVFDGGCAVDVSVRPSHLTHFLHDNFFVSCRHSSITTNLGCSTRQ